VKITKRQLKTIIRKLIKESLSVPAVSIDIEEEAVEPILDFLDDAFIDTPESLPSYPEEHLSADGRMFDYGSQKSDSQEGRMSKAKLFRMSQMSQSLHDRLEDGDDLPGWVQDKITTAEDRLQSAYDYMDYKIHRMEDEGCTCSEAIVRQMAREFLLRS